SCQVTLTGNLIVMATAAALSLSLSLSQPDPCMSANALPKSWHTSPVCPAHQVKCGWAATLDRSAPPGYFGMHHHPPVSVPPALSFPSQFLIWRNSSTEST